MPASQPQHPIHLIAIRAADYGRATMASSSPFDAADRMPETTPGWLVFAGARGHYVNQQTFLKAGEDHAAQMALASEGAHLNDNQRTALFSTDALRELAVHTAPRKTAMASLVPVGSAEELEKLFPNAQVHVLTTTEELGKAHDTLEQERIQQRRVRGNDPYAGKSR